eukprot:GEMP01037300.1.p1 GENE.GEMP01037300.1~~GEMP01037300.1.p1  ORF type:complete len:191 (+),score=36.93 GEMP01037300.1:183-755(+)
MNTLNNSAYLGPSGSSPYGTLQTVGSFVAAPYPHIQQGFQQQGFQQGYQQQGYGGYNTYPYHQYGGGSQYLPQQQQQQQFQAPSTTSLGSFGLQMPRLPMPSVGSFTLNLDNGPLGMSETGMYSGFGSGGSFAMAGPFAFYPTIEGEMEEEAMPASFIQRDKDVPSPKKIPKTRDVRVPKKKQQKKGCCT